MKSKLVKLNKLDMISDCTLKNCFVLELWCCKSGGQFKPRYIKIKNKSKLAALTF